MGRLAQGRTQTSPLDFWFLLFSLHLSLDPSPSFFIVGGKALEGAILVARRKRERERGKNLISCGLLSVGPESPCFRRPRASSSSSCRVCASPFSKNKEKTLFFSLFSQKKEVDDWHDAN